MRRQHGFLTLLGVALLFIPARAGAQVQGSTNQAPQVRDVATVPEVASVDTSQTPEPGGVQQVEESARKASPELAAESSAAPPEPKKAAEAYPRSRGYGTQQEPQPPRYVKLLSKHELLDFKEVDWLEFGLTTRARYEYRDDNYRRAERVLDEPILLKSNIYLGIREIADPFRFGLEFQDSRIFNSDFPESDRDVNENDFIQLFAELYFRNALGPDRPLRFQAGRMAFEYLDRRLISRNPWRNTTNNFDGFRIILGQETNDWQLDILAVQPVERRLSRPDRADEERWFYGVIGSWRRWSPHITLEPYYLVLDEDRKGAGLDRELHTLGLRGFGLFGQSGFDYDFDLIWQCGNSGDLRHRAFASTGEIGYTFKHVWKPRVSLFGGYASGDRDPADSVNERFDRLFGFARPWSASDYIIFENLITPKLRLEFQPHAKVRVDAGYGAYWLASDSDSWRNANLRDRTGSSGDFIGQELDTRIRWKVNDHTDLTVGYAYFIPGDFTENTSDADDSDFFYVELTLTF